MFHIFLINSWCLLCLKKFEIPFEYLFSPKRVILNNIFKVVFLFIYEWSWVAQINYNVQIFWLKYGRIHQKLKIKLIGVYNLKVLINHGSKKFELPWAGPLPDESRHLGQIVGQLAGRSSPGRWCRGSLAHSWSSLRFFDFHRRPPWRPWLAPAHKGKPD